MTGESLSDWASRRDAQKGALRASRLDLSDGTKGAHVAPDTPRIIHQWSGYSWEVHGVVSSLADAHHILYPRAQEPPPRPTVQPLQARGRHRKPQLE
ncbi:DUF6087 family protein [Streptomyces tardus]|uniref:DUF6087 family protein n=1 Tax=Streptomyces tardus TaxID=2780544 RepID=UPI001F2F9DCF|nr:DUF6087 family protein [Streptomyces tardus]